MDRTRRTTRLVAAALALAALGTACTDSLGSGGDEGGGGGTVEAWPQAPVAGTATSAALPQVTLDVHEVLRSGDGLTTLLLDVANEGNEDLTLDDVLVHDGVPRVTLYDPAANVEYRPLQIDHEYETGGCVCSSSGTTIAAGATTSTFVTYADVPEDVGPVRVQADRWTPVADVNVLDVGPFGEGAAQAMDVEDDDDLSVTVESVAPADEGTLVRLRYTNEGSSEPVELADFPAPGDLSVVDADGSAIFYPRVAEYEPVAGFADEDSLGRGESVTAEVLVAGLPDDVESVIVRGPRLRRSFPVPVSADTAAPAIDVPDTLDAEEIYELRTPTARYDTAMVPTAEPDEPAVDEAGAELPVPPVAQTLTSEAQPGWSVAVRGVVRGPGAFSTLLVDVASGSGEGSWPEGLGADETTDDLGGITVIDPAGQRLYGAYQSGGYAFGASETYSVSDGEAYRGYVLLPTLGDDVRQVTVDVPTFGRAEGVPVVDGPVEPDTDAEVPASLRAREDGRLRMDVLDVSHLTDDNGTLVRARVVNESNPDAVTTPFAGEGSDGICGLRLADPRTGNTYQALAPCETTPWSGSLAQGEGLVFEARFPNLPDDLSEVVVYGAGWYPSAPVAVGEDGRPWYLSLPRTAEEPEGATYAAARGTADGFGTTTQVGDTVEVTLATDVLFAFDSAELTPEAATRVGELAEELGADATGGTVTITGHTDDVGEDAYNQALSEQRAAAVQAALEPATGRSDLAYEASGSGEADPVAPNSVNGRPNPDGQAANRRVTVSYQVEEPADG